MLSARHLNKAFGSLVVAQDLSLEIPAGARHALIGPNGAGKTTLINLLTGVVAPTRGDVFLGEERITALQPHKRVKRGLARTFQINTHFPGLTVLESVVLAVLERKGLAARWSRAVADFRAELEEAREILAGLKLDADAGTRTAELPYGRQRLLEIALALASRPRILLLDEPAAGMNQVEVDQLTALIRKLAASGRTILLIEHHVGLVMSLCDRIAVLNFGTKLAEGTPAEIAANPQVVEAYLGQE